jgi:hypothetical protein
MDIISPTKFSTGDIKYSPNLALVTLNTPQTSEPYNNIGLIVRKSVNHASLSELGRYPLYYDIVKTILKYCYRLENLSTEFPLLQEAFLCSKKLHSMNKTSWYSSVI